MLYNSVPCCTSGVWQENFKILLTLCKGKNQKGDTYELKKNFAGDSRNNNNYYAVFIMLNRFGI